MAKAAKAVKTLVITSKTELKEPELQLLNGYNQLRSDYVIQEGWPIGANMIDQDAYDRDEDNIYIIAYEKNYVLAGMRATRVESLEGSLSYGMWHDVVEKQVFDNHMVAAQARIKELSDYDLWDLTRLVTDVSILGQHSTYKRATSRVGLYKVMAAAMKAASGSIKTAWIFTTTEKMTRFLDRLGIPYHVLCRARISHTDPGESVLSIIYPHDALSVIKARNRYLHRIVENHLKTKI